MRASRTLVTYARPEAFAPHTCSLLTKIGYRLLTEEEFKQARAAGEIDRPDLLIADERRLGELPEEEGCAAPGSSSRASVA